MAADKKKELFVEATQLIKAGKYGQASKSLKELIALEPANLEYRRLSASLNLKLGNLISAKAVYDSLVRESMQMRDYRLAESLLREYLAAGPRYIPFLELLGQALEEKGNGLVAANEYGKALQILLEDADPDEANHAADLYGKIQRLSPNNPALAQYDPTKFTRAPQPAAPSPLETAMKMKEAAPPPVPPPAPVVQAPLAASPPPAAPPPAPAAPAGQKPAKRAKLLDDAPMVDDDLTDVLTPKERPKPKPAPKPAAPSPPPLVDDDLTDLLSRPIPKVTKAPKFEPLPPAAAEKPSLAKTLLGFFQSSPAPAPPPSETPPVEAPPPAEAPPSPPPAAPVEAAPAAAPVEAAPAAPPQWKPWQPEPEEAPAPVAEAPPPAPAAEPQAAEWKPWQPSESTAPAAHAGAQPAGKGDFFVVDSKKGMGESAPSLGTAMPKIPSGRRTPQPMPIRAVGRRAGRLGQTVRKLMMAAVGLGIVTGLLLGTLAIGCFILEKSPSDAFRNFSGAPPLSSQDPRRNAYALLLGFDADAGRDPMAEGYERLQGPVSAKSIQCAWETPSSPMSFPAEAAAVETWWLGPDPVGQFQKEAATIQGWTAGSPVLMGRYRQWVGLEFEDGGYGKFAVPNCALIVAAHRLHVAEGFGQGLAKGIDGLEKDLLAWRRVLAQARTLPVKQLALTAANDNLTLLTGVFSRPELTPDMVSRLAQSELLKPLEQVERSLRWPMQNALTMDAKLFGTSALFDAVRDPSPLLQVLAHLPLPKQRALNAYADYFEALIKAADQPLTKPPLLYEFARTPAKTVFDYATNPLDNLVPNRTVIVWDQQIGAVQDIEARLRLVGVTAMLRGVPRKNIPVRIAQAGPKYTDPYTELPLLLNTSRGLIYSVGKNRKDDDGDPKLDVSVPWPMNEPPKEAPKGRR